jgi:hypothetical protein
MRYIYLVNFRVKKVAQMFGVLNKTHYLCNVFGEHT